MNDKQKKAFQIAIQTLSDIATRKAGATFTYPRVAQNAIKLVMAALKDGEFTLDTDSTGVTPEFNTAKEFVELYIKDAGDAELTELSEYTDKTGKTRVLYELCVAAKAATDDMTDWLDLANVHYTTQTDGLLVYFEIFRSIGTETAFIIQK